MGGHRAPMLPLGATLPAPHLHICTSLEAPRCPQFGDFYGGFPAQARSMLDSISSPSPLSGGQGRGAESAKPLIVAGFFCDAHPAANQEPPGVAH